MWRISPAGDTGLLVVLGDGMSPRLLGGVLALDRALRESPPAGLTGTVPAYASLMCRFDPLRTDPASLEAQLRLFEGRLEDRLPAGRPVDVPVHYDGPDLQEVAAHTGLSPAEVARVHAGTEYLVYCIGFAPGFSYCGELPAVLATPRLPSPRRVVPAGSVGIAGRQTGIYAVESPGGWNLIGRTELKLFDADRDPPTWLEPGDRLRFRLQT